MADMTLKFPRGSVIVMTVGSYSDYRIAGLLVALVDCDLPALARDFAAEERARLKNAVSECCDVETTSDFPAWLIAKGHCMQADHSLVHLGDVEDWEDEFGVPTSNTQPGDPA